MMKGFLTFLGTGASMGIPVIGCSCSVCLSTHPYNKRLRTSVLINYANRKIIIDVGPDFRFQCLHYGIAGIDGVLITHAHYDHIAGIDDLRPLYYNRESPLPIFLSEETAQEVALRYHYLLPSALNNASPQLKLEIFQGLSGQFMLEGIPVQFVTYEQGKMKVNGFRIGNLAYLTDIRQFSQSIFEQLKGVKILIISALRFTPSPLHLSVDEAIDFSKQISAEQVWLTHIAHDLDHLQTNAYLPANVRVAYDGLKVEFY